MMSSLGTSSPVSASTLAYLMRWPVVLLIWLKLTFSVSDVAGKSATGQVTRDSFKKPFQFARGAICWNSITPMATQLVRRRRVPSTALRTGISYRFQHLAHGDNRLLRRQAGQRIPAGDVWWAPPPP